MVEGKIKGAFAGMLFGFLLVPGSLLLQAWNEYRTIHRTRGLNEAESSVVALASNEEVDSAQESQLVHLTGHAHTDEVLVDEEFGIRENAVRLEREVEMFQWVEDSRERDGKRRYEYDTQWHEGRVNSESFHESGHVNPALKFEGESQLADQVLVGAFQLNNTLKRGMKNWQNVPFTLSAVQEVVGPERSEQFAEEGEWLYWSPNGNSPGSPEVGDHRVRFRMVPNGDVSVMAMQKGNSFGTYHTSNGEPIERLYDGLLSVDEFMSRLRVENTMIAWGLRILGCFLCVAGISLIMGPARALVSWIPLVGDVTGWLIFVVAAILGISLSLITISIAWIAVRPLFGIALLAIAVAGIYVILRLRKSTQQEAPVIDSSMFVEP